MEECRLGQRASKYVVDAIKEQFSGLPDTEYWFSSRTCILLCSSVSIPMPGLGILTMNHQSSQTFTIAGQRIKWIQKSTRYWSWDYDRVVFLQSSSLCTKVHGYEILIPSRFLFAFVLDPITDGVLPYAPLLLLVACIVWVADRNKLEHGASKRLRDWFMSVCRLKKREWSLCWSCVLG